MFTVTITTDNPAILVAIGNAVKNIPPAGYEEGRPKPVEVNVHSTLKEAKNAKETVNLAENAKAVAKPVEPEPKPEPKPEAKPSPDDVEKRRQELRSLVVKVGKETNKGLKEVTQIAVDAAGLQSASELSACSVEAYEKAKKALEDALTS